MLSSKLFPVSAANTCSTNTQWNGAEVATKSTLKSPAERTAIAELEKLMKRLQKDNADSVKAAAYVSHITRAVAPTDARERGVLRCIRSVEDGGSNWREAGFEKHDARSEQVQAAVGQEPG